MSLQNGLAFRGTFVLAEKIGYAQHLDDCRFATAIIASSVAVAVDVNDLSLASSLFLMVWLLPSDCLWLGKPKQAMQKRPAGHVADASNAARAVDPSSKRPKLEARPSSLQEACSSSSSNVDPMTSSNPRYDKDFWGKAWGRSSRRRRIKKQERSSEGLVVDLALCRSLLTSLDPDDLRSRLKASAGPRTIIEESWLREAALAFSVAIRKTGGAHKKVDDLIDEVCAKARVCGQATAASEPAPEPASEPALPVARPLPETIPPSQRYQFDSWGKYGQSKGGRGHGNIATRAHQEVNEPSYWQAEADVEWDLAACRSLLLTLSADDLRARLLDSPWRQGKAPRGVNWLKEAAAAFGVAIKTSRARGATGTYKPKEDIVQEVVNQVVATQAIQIGSSSERDERRRQERMESLVRRADVLAARKRITLLHTVAGMDFQQMREDVLLFECPEKLRQAIVAEHIARCGALPQADAPDLIGRRAALYAQSALERSHLSTAAGPQLTHEERLAWDEVWATLPLQLRPLWQEDPVLLRAQEFYDRYGHLNVQKHNLLKLKQMAAEERAGDKLARELDVVRRAKVQDVKDYVRCAKRKGNGWSTLLRRKLSAEAVAKWEDSFGPAWAWLPGRIKEAYMPSIAMKGPRVEWTKVHGEAKATEREQLGSAGTEGGRTLASSTVLFEMAEPEAVALRKCIIELEEERDKAMEQRDAFAARLKRGRAARRDPPFHAGIYPRPRRAPTPVPKAADIIPAWMMKYEDLT